MKKLIASLTALVFAGGLALPVAAADEHHHHAKAGPTGGRLLTKVEPHVEFFVNKDNKVEIRFVDEDNKVVAPAKQIVTVTLGDRRKPTKLAFTQDGDKLISNAPVPEGNNHPTVVQIKVDPKAKVVTERFNLNLSDCPTCEHREYACICEHGDDHDHDHHDHDKEKKK